MDNPDILDYTMNSDMFGSSVSDMDSYKLEVKTCESAFILLYNSITKNSSLPMYTVLLGTKGTYPEVRIGKRSDQCQHCVKSVVNGTLLDCNFYTKLWFSWKQGLIKVGRGDVLHLDIVISWQDMSPFEVRGIGFGTRYGSTGEWILPFECKYYIYAAIKAVMI